MDQVSNVAPFGRQKNEHRRLQAEESTDKQRMTVEVRKQRAEDGAQNERGALITSDYDYNQA